MAFCECEKMIKRMSKREKEKERENGSTEKSESERG